MEESVFPLPAVARILQKEFIEARLHNDGGPREVENRSLQNDFAGNPATPNYVIIDAKTGKKVRVRAGYMGQSVFIEFLRGKALE